MELSDSDYDKFNDWYKANIPAFKCEICGSNSCESPLSMPSNIFTVNGLDGRSAYPLIILSCISCGNTRFLSVVVLEQKGCPIFHFLPKKNNILRFLDYFKKGKK